MNYPVGIDVSKGKSTVTLMDGTEKLKKYLTYNIINVASNCCWSISANILKKKTRIVMEATSHYNFSLFFPLQEAGFFVCVDALSVKKFFDEDLRRAKNDKKDSIKSAMFCCEKWNRLLEFQPQESIRNDLLFLSREYSKNVQVQSRLKIQLSGLVDKIFFGLKITCKYKKPICSPAWYLWEMLACWNSPFHWQRSIHQRYRSAGKKNGHRADRKIGVGGGSNIRSYPTNSNPAPKQPYYTACCNELCTVAQTVYPGNQYHYNRNRQTDKDPARIPGCFWHERRWF